MKQTMETKKLEKMTLKELITLSEEKRNDGYIFNPELKFNGFKGRITKAMLIWFISNLVKK
jgi:hypothetical protein